MKRVNNIFKHKIYQQEMEKIDCFEQDRIYCRHGVEHQLEVARMAYIMVLEEKRSIEKELIYAAALLHDIGRGMQYQTNMAHEKASVLLAETILPECGFLEHEISEIVDAIDSHRVTNKENLSDLAKIIYKADKKSRNCFLCKSADTCYWPEDKKNHSLEL